MVWIMDQVPQELTAILAEIEKALDAKLYYLAIAVALSVPDICACLEFDSQAPKWANRDTYTRKVLKSVCRDELSRRSRRCDLALRLQPIENGHSGITEGPTSARCEAPAPRPCGICG